MTRSALLSMTVMVAAAAPAGARDFPGTATVDFNGYSGCIELSNETTRVVLGPQIGGRVLGYAYQGKQAIFRNPEHDGWTYEPGKPTIDVCGGRMDIGPECVIPRHPTLWFGTWKAEATGPRSARMTSQPDEATGVQLIRDFQLAARGSRLQVTQTIRNVSKEAKHWCHWSRTLAAPSGIAVVPLNLQSRFPKGFILYGPGSVLDYSPADEPNIRRRDGFLEIHPVPGRPKFGIDSVAEWLAYAEPNDLLFVKRFPVYPDRPYNEMAAYTVCIYYVKEFTELEPIGPKTNIRPGASASYTEEWELLPFTFPKEGEDLDLKAVERLAGKAAKDAK